MEPSEKMPVPCLTSVDPDFGPAGTEVTIKGTNLAGVERIIWACNSKKVKSEPDTVSSTMVKGEVPQGVPQGDGCVSVASRAGESNRLPFTFEG